MSTLNQKLEYIKYFTSSKTIFEKHLVHCLQVPIYKYLANTYNELFDKQNNTDAKVIVLFQQHMQELKELSPGAVNATVKDILQHCKCAKYISKLIDVILTVNNKILLLGTEVPSELYEKPSPNALLFFRNLFVNIGDNFYRDPFIFIKNQANGSKLQCNDYILRIIEKCIIETVQSMLFFPDMLDYYLETLNNIHYELLTTISESSSSSSDSSDNDNTDNKTTNANNANTNNAATNDNKQSPQNNAENGTKSNKDENKGNEDKAESKESKGADKDSKDEDKGNEELSDNEEEEEESADEQKQSKVEKEAFRLDDENSLIQDNPIPNEYAIIPYKTEEKESSGKTQHTKSSKKSKKKDKIFTV